jgi:hypothetical protein
VNPATVRNARRAHLSFAGSAFAACFVELESEGTVMLWGSALTSPDRSRVFSM